MIGKSSSRGEGEGGGCVCERETDRQFGVSVSLSCIYFSLAVEALPEALCFDVIAEVWRHREKRARCLRQLRPAEARLAKAASRFSGLADTPSCARITLTRRSTL